MSQIDFLTDAFIDDLLGTTRERGGYGRFLLKFAESGEKYIDVRTDASFAKKDTAALLNSMSQNIKKLTLASTSDGKPFPRMRAVKTKDEPTTVIVVNMDLYAPQDAETDSE